jgi:uncharacterized membrane protein YeaQ/YmgE (transglycosylase-associated protein family)
MGILTWVVWGLFVGAIARLLLPGRQKLGIIWTIVLGVGGSVLGGLIATGLLDIADSDEFDLGSFVIAIGTSVVLLAVVERVNRMLPDRERDRDRLEHSSYRRR